ncbi:hypothetical protein [Escherichia phage C6]|nr:hypothetical protein [Escherichia phage C6]
MEIGKKYELRPECIKAFINITPINNNDMVDLIQDNGGWFEVKDMLTIDGDKFVTKIECANGEIYNEVGLGPNYFELHEDEFYCFREYAEQDEVDEPITKAGVTQIHCIVTEQNVDQIIELLQKTFKA